MKRPLFFSSLLLPLALTVAPAQQVTTASDFGVLARVNRHADHQAVPQGTSIDRRGLHLRAAAAASRSDGAFAAVAVDRADSMMFGRGIVLREIGAVGLADPNAAGAAGTSGSPPNAMPPSFGRHALGLHYPVTAGSAGVVTLVWRGDASQGAGAGVAVDVDGDGMADFTGRADGNPVVQHIPVTAGRRGVVIAVVAAADAQVHGAGRAGYAASLGVFFREAPTPPNCTLTSFGRPCGGQLSGSVQTGRHGNFVELDVTGAAGGSLGALVLGQQFQTPRPLPASMCNLLVDPAVWTPIRIDAAGNGTTRVGLPNRRPIQVDFQVITLSIGRGVQVASTNGLNLACR